MVEMFLNQFSHSLVLQQLQHPLFFSLRPTHQRFSQSDSRNQPWNILFHLQHLAERLQHFQLHQHLVKFVVLADQISQDGEAASRGLVAAHEGLVHPHLEKAVLFFGRAHDNELLGSDKIALGEEAVGFESQQHVFLLAAGVGVEKELSQHVAIEHVFDRDLPGELTVDV